MAVSRPRGRLPSTWLPQAVFVVATVLAYVFAPAVDGKHPPDRLETFFILALTATVTLGIALLTFQRVGKNASALRFLTPFTVAYVVMGVAVSIAGVLPFSDGVYRYLFGLTAGAVLALLSTLALFAVASLAGQQHEATAEAEAETETLRNTYADMQLGAKKIRKGKTQPPR
jgi:hypothetical protein